MASDTISGKQSSLTGGVSVTQYRGYAKELLDLIVNYKKNLAQQTPMPDVEPGFLKEILPADAPQEPEPWKHVLQDVESLVTKGIFNLHNSTQMHGYYPNASSNAANLGSMVQDAVGGLTNIWLNSPAGVELEMITMDWLARSMALPEYFLHGGTGGGIIMTSSTEGALMSICAARNKKIKEMQASDSSLSSHSLLARLVLYSSTESNFNVDRACRLVMVQHHQVSLNKAADHLSMRGAALQQVMEQDRKKGLIPFFVVATLGTTSTCAFDNLAEIGPLCTASGCWMHVDAAYAGAAFLCPEFRHYLQGVEHVDSISVNFYKWMLMSAGCAGFWIKDSALIVKEFSGEAQLLEMPFGQDMPMFMHVALAKYAADLLQQGDMFSITHPVSMGLVCFKLKKQPDSVNKHYLRTIQKDRRLYLIGSSDQDGFFLRLCMHTENLSKRDVEKSVHILQELATQ